MPHLFSDGSVGELPPEDIAALKDGAALAIARRNARDEARQRRQLVREAAQDTLVMLAGDTTSIKASVLAMNDAQLRQFIGDLAVLISGLVHRG